jgi:hypothetical protein
MIDRLNAIITLHTSLGLAHKENYFWKQILLNPLRFSVRTFEYNSYCHAFPMSSQSVMTENSLK